MNQVTAFHRAHDLEDAWALVREGGGSARLLGGGTDLAVDCPPDVTTLVDLAHTGLDGVRVEDDGSLQLGAMATFTTLLEHPAVRAHGTGVVAQMLSQVGSVLHRNSATLGGHLARGRMSDVIPVLVALDANVVTYDGEEHELPVSDYHARATDPHVITQVRLPALSDRSAATFLRFSRTSFDHAILNGCCRVELDAGEVAACRIVIGETAVLGRRASGAEQLLLGGPLDDGRIDATARAAREEVDTRGDWVATAEYRSHLVEVTVRRCLRVVGQLLTGGSA